MQERDTKLNPLDLLASLFVSGRGAFALDESAWCAALALPVFEGLGAEEQSRLHALAQGLLADKAFSGAGGLEVDAAMAT